MGRHKHSSNCSWLLLLKASCMCRNLFSWTLGSDPAECSGWQPHELCRAPCGLSPEFLSVAQVEPQDPQGKAEPARQRGENVQNWRGFVFCKQKEVHFLY